MSIAMTVVLPAPVASFRASRRSSGLASLLAAARCSRIRLPAFDLGSDLGQPDGGFHGLDLAEERAKTGELVMSPVLEQAGRFGSDLPLARLGPGPPSVHMAAHLVDDRRGVVLLLRGRKPLALVEDHDLLRAGFLPFPRPGNGRDEFGPAAGLDDPLRRLALLVEFPMPPGTFIRRVQDRMFEEGIGHVRSHEDSDRNARPMKGSRRSFKARRRWGVGRSGRRFRFNRNPTKSKGLRHGFRPGGSAAILAVGTANPGRSRRSGKKFEFSRTFCRDTLSNPAQRRRHRLSCGRPVCACEG